MVYWVGGVFGVYEGCEIWCDVEVENVFGGCILVFGFGEGQDFL